MLTRDVRLEGFTTDDWVRLAEVFRAPLAPREREEPSAVADSPTREAPGLPRRRGGVIAVTTGERLRKLLSTDSGRLDVRAESWPAPLPVLAARHHARFAARIETGALEELMERFAQRLRREQDALEQLWVLFGILRELESEGRIEVHPWKLASWPVPHHRVMVRVLDALCPSGKAIVFGAFQDGELFTALVLRRRGEGFDLVLGPDELRGRMGLVSGDFHRDYRYLSRAAEACAAPLALGVFGEVHTLRKLLHSPRAGAWAAAVAARDVIVSPATPAIALPLGVDVGRAALAVARDLAVRLGADGWLGERSPLYPLLQGVRDLTGVDRDVRELLGFDPMMLLRKLFSRSAAPADAEPAAEDAEPAAEPADE